MTKDPLVELLERQKQDLVERLLTEHVEAKNSRSFINLLMMKISDLLLVISTDLDIVNASKELYAVLGYGGNQPLSLCEITSPEVCRELVDRLSGGDFTDHETSLVDSNGQEIPVTIRGTTFTTPSGRRLFLLNASDRRDIYSVMEEMREVQKQLMHSGRLASLGEMAAGMGHELTQPLNTVLLLARNSLKALDLPEPDLAMVRENLETIVDRANHSSFIIKSLKGFTTRFEEETVPVPVNATVVDILSFLENQLDVSSVKVELNLDQGNPRVLCMQVRLEQVLLNIIRNAIQAMGCIDVPLLMVATAREQVVDPESLQRKIYVAITVRDNGEGIPLEQQEKIFDPFFSSREVGTGMGLGLAIVDRIVRGYRGHIRLESALGAGATFTVYLPEAR